MESKNNNKKDIINIIIRKIVIEENCWKAPKTIIAPGSILKKGSVSFLGSVVSGILQEDGIYKGNPAKLLKSKDDNLN